MRREAQLELLQLYDMAIQYDMRIIEKCRTLKWIWEIFSKRIDSSGVYHPCCNDNYCLYDNPCKRQYYKGHDLFCKRRSYPHTSYSQDALNDNSNRCMY